MKGKLNKIISLEMEDDQVQPVAPKYIQAWAL